MAGKSTGKRTSSKIVVRRESVRPGSAGEDRMLAAYGLDSTVHAAVVTSADPLKSTRFHLHARLFHVTYVQRGRGHCQLGGELHALTPGRIHFIYPGEPHSFHADRKHPYRKFMLKLLVAEDVPRVFPRMLSAGRRRKSLDRICRQLVRDHAAALTGSRSARIHERMSLLALFDELFALADKAPSQAEYQAPPAATKAFSQLLSRLETPPFDSPGLDTLAKQVHMSRRQFTRTFRSITGMSLHRFVVQARMTYAAKRLAAGDVPVKQVAAECGYTNPQNFIRAYRAEHGKTPGGRRRM